MYSGPLAGEDNLCVCNTVVYSLVSACGACQGATSWVGYALSLPARASLDDVLPGGPHGTSTAPSHLQMERESTFQMLLI